MSAGPVSQRLAELGIELPEVAAPVAAYVPARQDGAQVRTSGQLPFVDGELPVCGKVGGQVTAEQAQKLARQCALNALAAAADVVGLDNLAGVVHVTGFVASTTDFTGQPGVINGASELFGDIFGADGAHTRSAVGVPVLPLDSAVEVEVTFAVR
ncbi:RidA family protein [Trueperella bialowiezensis]|uniref:Putative endoribonuclease L-PSP n=1 Tax=Trueperella bialowiezensis TaxID=312285 RepID=A0A3S4UYS9_9ACTO|nr:RidA family protein [Trueperella bialowiezensis]VEI13162.1 putative endoribonuclease L-PSP [Trueperella bialowiezensis]